MDVRSRLRQPVVIPAHPLALDAGRRLDERSQRAMSRYYVAAGADGLAVGVHTTQFELHLDHGMLGAVLRLAAEEAAGRLLVAGIAGDTPAAVREAEMAVEAGYSAALLTSWGVVDRTEAALVERARAVGKVLPVIAFYLQESVGGQYLSPGYWSSLFDLDSVVGVKVAPFDRYRTGDVLRTLVEHDRWSDIAVLTGNDDAVVADLVTPVTWRDRTVRATGGLLGQWAVGTRAARRVLDDATRAVEAGRVPLELLRTGADLTQVNAAVFDVAHDFAGCVPGVNEVLRQQGLIKTTACLGEDTLSWGQTDLIASVRERFPDLLDEGFVQENVDAWRA